MKTLLFSYGSLILDENLKKFNSKILKSVFVKDLGLDIIKSPITKRNYHYIRLIEKKGNILPGFLIETSNIQSIDKWEGSSYKRKKIICFTRTLEEIECYAYFNN